MRKNACERCKRHQVFHSGDKKLCCLCHMETNGTAADWHDIDMAYEKHKARGKLIIDYKVINGEIKYIFAGEK
jgi:hypothetical protein